MHHSLGFLLIAACLAVPAAAQAPAPAAALREGDLVAVCGDSITEQKQYSVFLEAYLLACRPRPGLRAMQFGWGGERAPGFLARMGNVERFPVTVATTCYGMNDGGYGPLTPEIAKTYRDGLTAIVERFQKAGVRFVVVGAPGVVDSQTFRKSPAQAEVYNRTLGQLRDVAREVAAAQGVGFADVYGAMAEAMPKAKAKFGADYPFAGGDGVHPGPAGHLVMAYAFLKAFGCDGDLGTITVDLAAGKAEAAGGHRVLSCAAGGVEVESARYPFCFAGEATRGILDCVPFNAELNRLRLVVTDAGAERLKITWGGATKAYAAADLAKGINLAAEFLDNPFGEAFHRVEEAVRAQQNYETPLVKEMLQHWPEYVRMVPEQQESFDKIAAAALERAKALRDAAAAAVAPVRHTIRIEKGE